MAELSKWWEELTEEIKVVNAEAKDARMAWLSAKEKQEKADLKEVWQQLVKEQEALLAERKDLGVGVRCAQSSTTSQVLSVTLIPTLL